jgi:hypothetical protein
LLRLCLNTTYFGPQQPTPALYWVGPLVLILRGYFYFMLASSRVVSCLAATQPRWDGSPSLGRDTQKFLLSQYTACYLLSASSSPSQLSSAYNSLPLRVSWSLDQSACAHLETCTHWSTAAQDTQCNTMLTRPLISPVPCSSSHRSKFVASPAASFRSRMSGCLRHPCCHSS